MDRMIDLHRVFTNGMVNPGSNGWQPMAGFHQGTEDQNCSVTKNCSYSWHKHCHGTTD